MEAFRRRFEEIERYVQEHGPGCEQRITNLEQLAVQRIRTVDEGLERIERLEAHLDRLGDVIDGVFDVLCVMHPESAALFETVKADARAKLRVIEGGRRDPA